MPCVSTPPSPHAPERTRRETDRPPTFELTERDNLARLAWRQAALRPQHASFELYTDGAWRVRSAADHLGAVVESARGLLGFGVDTGSRVALSSGTRYEWLLLDSAVWAVGGVTVPIYPTSSAAQVEWIVRDSGARLIIVETEAMRRLVERADLGHVEVLVIDDSAAGALQRLRAAGRDVPAERVEERASGVTLAAPASIVYTSGTTGRPKGCVLTHANLAAETRALLSQPIGEVAVPGRRTLMFLPLAHVLARAVTYALSAGGATVGFWADTATLVEQLGVFRPHVVLGVPRVFEKVHAGVRSAARHGGPAKAEIFRRAERVAIEWSRAQEPSDSGAAGPGLRLRAEHAVFDRLVYRAVRSALGGQCEYAISGGGALRPDLTHFFRGLGVPIYEGYGLTETCAAITVNERGATRVGSVGRPVGGNAVRVTGSGELQVRGRVVFEEYWGNHQASVEAFDDGWFRTGDLGSIDADGFVWITGRSKEIIVTAGGKNVVPGPIEEALRAHPVIGHALLVGEGRPFVSALITLDADGARAWARDNGIDGSDLTQLCDNQQLRALVQSAVDEASAQVSRAEAVRAFSLLPEDLTEEAGELTATLKVKRHVVEERYARQIESMYHPRHH